MSLKVVVEQHRDGFEAYPLGLRTRVSGHGPTREQALATLRDAVAYHVRVFGDARFESCEEVLDADLTELPMDERFG